MLLLKIIIMNIKFYLTSFRCMWSDD